MQGQKLDPQLIEKILLSGNRFVKKFKDSIEFYDDGAMDENDEPVLDKTAADALVRERLSKALRKLERVGA